MTEKSCIDVMVEERQSSVVKQASLLNNNAYKPNIVTACRKNVHVFQLPADF